jgi:hypothetical protein
MAAFQVFMYGRFWVFTEAIFLLTDNGLTVVRCLAAEREHQIAAQRKNEN